MGSVTKHLQGVVDLNRVLLALYAAVAGYGCHTCDPVVIGTGTCAGGAVANCSSGSGVAGGFVKGSGDCGGAGSTAGIVVGGVSLEGRGRGSWV